VLRRRRLTGRQERRRSPRFLLVSYSPVFLARRVERANQELAVVPTCGDGFGWRRRRVLQEDRSSGEVHDFSWSPTLLFFCAACQAANQEPAVIPTCGAGFGLRRRRVLQENRSAGDVQDFSWSRTLLFFLTRRVRPRIKRRPSSRLVATDSVCGGVVSYRRTGAQETFKISPDLLFFLRGVSSARIKSRSRPSPATSLLP
jgi:hypothetical protein